MGNTDTSNTLKCINKIYVLAKEKGIKIGDLEDKIGKATGYFGRFKNGKIKSLPSADVLDKVAKELDVSVDFLINEEAERCSKEDLICCRFISRLAKDTNCGLLTWNYYGITNKKNLDNEEIPQVIRDIYLDKGKSLKEGLERYGVDTNITHFDAYMTEIDEMRGQMCLIHYKTDTFDGVHCLKPETDSCIELFFIDDSGTQRITGYSIYKSLFDIKQLTLSELWNAIARKTNTISKSLVNKMNAFLEEDVQS